MIAHEAVHIIQKRHAVHAQADVGELEREACLGASFVRRETTFRPQLPDPGSAARFWGPAGHYYTVYFVMLAAGFSPEVARLRAVCCQLPDQVHDFDATAGALDYMFGSGFDMGGFHSVHPAYPSHREYVSGDLEHGQVGGWRSMPHRETSTEILDRRREDMEVQAGLHSLTGISSEEETAFRRKILETEAKADHLLFGLALHGFGDSFAHRQQGNEKFMYKTGPGHGAELGDVGHTAKIYRNQVNMEIGKGNQPLAQTARNLGHMHMEASHAPDNIGSPLKGREGVYVTYVSMLYDIFSKLSDGRPKLTLGQTLDYLRRLTSIWHPEGEKSEAAHIAALRNMAGHPKILNTVMGPYAPEHEDPEYWTYYSVVHLNDLAASGHKSPVEAYQLIRRAAKRWSRTFGHWSSSDDVPRRTPEHARRQTGGRWQ